MNCSAMDPPGNRSWGWLTWVVRLEDARKLFFISSSSPFAMRTSPLNPFCCARDIKYCSILDAGPSTRGPRKRLAQTARTRILLISLMKVLVFLLRQKSRSDGYRQLRNGFARNGHLALVNWYPRGVAPIRSLSEFDCANGCSTYSTIF